MSNVVKQRELELFATTAKPLDQMVYFWGRHLAETIISQEVQKIAYEYATKGLIYLVQKRNELDKYEFLYIAIKASKPPLIKLVPLSDKDYYKFKGNYVRPDRIMERV